MGRASWFLLLVLLCLLARESCGEKHKYCKHPCKNTWGDEHTHTMCKYESSEPSAFCNNYKKYSRLNKTAQAEIVDLHNRLRDHVAMGLQLDEREELMPAAANMLELTWDDELAEIAQRWVDQCILGEDMCRDVKRFPVAQNVAVTIHDLKNETELKKYIPTAIPFWFDKVQDFSFAEDSKIELIQTVGQWTPTTNQFSQIIWADTSAVGCGRAVFEREAKIHELFACNYGPAGNIFGKVVYAVGQPCSFCPSKMSCSKRYDALCSVDGVGRRSVQQELGKKEKHHGKRSRGSRLSPPVSVFCACVLCAAAIL